MQNELRVFFFSLSGLSFVALHSIIIGNAWILEYTKPSSQRVVCQSNFWMLYMFKAGEITQEEYDRWRYRYPEFDSTQRWVKVPSQELSDMLVEALKDKE